jgi:anti-anti-sigma regulatory factor
MLKIRRVQNGELVFRLSGRMDAENIGELIAQLGTKTTERHIVLDLEDLTLVDQEVVSYLVRSEADGIELRNCPAYIREWIKGERG